MKLRVLSNYGENEQVVTEDATPEIIQKTVHSLNWQEFHQVLLERSSGDWMEVGGSLNPEDGFSVMYEENGRQLVIKTPPTRIDEMTEMLLAYLSGSEDWKRGADWG